VIAQKARIALEVQRSNEMWILLWDVLRSSLIKPTFASYATSI
jgi:hypothetical protein